MSLKRWNPRRDQNEKAIVDAIERTGARVMRLDTFDLLIWYRGALYMLDAKTPTGRPTKAQQRLIDDGWPLHFVPDELSALRQIGALR